MSQQGWIGVDLDGTLAHYDGWRGVEHIGEPIPAMLERVKKWLAEGKDVRIFTARVCSGDASLADAKTRDDYWDTKWAIESWCKHHVGRVLPITHKKDYAMIELWDDRAVQVEPNTGRRVDGKE